jgi:hypothetical protein
MLQQGGTDFQWSASNTTAPASSAAWGTAVTPGASNVMGSYATIIAAGSVTHDVYGIYINFSSGGTTTAARDILADIGIDTAGGTSFTALIPSLLASCASTRLGATPSGGIDYYFPLFIPAGSTIGCRAQVNNGTAGSVRCHVIVFGDPSNPELVRCGSFARAFGATAASSSGTAVTPGSSAAEGTYVQLGSATVEDLWWWQVGLGVNDATMAAVSYMLDIAAGDASNKRILIENVVAASNATEELMKELGPFTAHQKVTAGDLVYGRASCSGTPDSNVSMIAYAVGGMA